MSCLTDKEDSCVTTLFRVWVGQPRVQIPAGARDVFLLHNVQNGSRVHPASYSIGAGGCFIQGVKWLEPEAAH